MLILICLLYSQSTLHVYIHIISHVHTIPPVHRCISSLHVWTLVCNCTHTQYHHHTYICTHIYVSVYISYTACTFVYLHIPYPKEGQHIYIALWLYFFKFFCFSHLHVTTVCEVIVPISGAHAVLVPCFQLARGPARDLQIKHTSPRHLSLVKCCRLCAFYPIYTDTARGKASMLSSWDVPLSAVVRTHVHCGTQSLLGTHKWASGTHPTPLWLRRTRTTESPCRA